MKRLKILLTVAFSFVMLALPAAAYAATASGEAVCEGVGIAAGSSGCGNGTGPSINGVIETAISILSILVGVVAVIVIILSGLKYITAGGDSSKISSAKDTLIYAIIGLIIATLAQVIVRFVLNKV